MRIAPLQREANAYSRGAGKSLQSRKINRMHNQAPFAHGTIRPGLPLLLLAGLGFAMAAPTTPGAEKSRLATASTTTSPRLVIRKLGTIDCDMVERIAKGVNVCNSDVDLCELKNKVVLYYCWGNQNGIEHLAEARYDGSLRSILKGFFP
jgi:hypothetical protein